MWVHKGRSPSHFAIVRSRRLAVQRGFPGPSRVSWPTSSVCLQEVPDQFTLRTSRSVAKPTSCAGMLVKRRRCRSSAVGTQSVCLPCRMRWMLSLSKTANFLSSALYGTIFHTANKNRILCGRIWDGQE